MRKPLISTKPTLYLDYDGVLHPDEVYRDKHGHIYINQSVNTQSEPVSLFMHAPLLAQMIDGRDLQIVLATSWVKVLSFDRACARLPMPLQQRIAGATYHRHNKYDWDHYTRYQQIQQHATRHSLQQWKALDNDLEGWPHYALDKICACDDDLGFIPVVDQLTHWLDTYAPKLEQSSTCSPEM